MYIIIVVEYFLGKLFLYGFIYRSHRMRNLHNGPRKGRHAVQLIRYVSAAT